MKAYEIEVINQIISNTMMSGNEKRDAIVSMIESKCKELEDKYCTCSEEETTGSTTFECCNICGKILNSKT